MLFNYISCYFGSNMTAKSFSVAEIPYSAHWYLFPLKSQRLIVQMIHQAQTSFILKGYSIVDCSLPTYAKVNINFYSVFSYTSSMVYLTIFCDWKRLIFCSFLEWHCLITSFSNNLATRRWNIELNAFFSVLMHSQSQNVINKFILVLMAFIFLII